MALHGHGSVDSILAVLQCHRIVLTPEEVACTSATPQLLGHPAPLQIHVKNSLSVTSSACQGGITDSRCFGRAKPQLILFQRLDATCEENICLSQPVTVGNQYSRIISAVSCAAPIGRAGGHPYTPISRRKMAVRGPQAKSRVPN
jgi:hypothetical protein